MHWAGPDTNILEWGFGQLPVVQIICVTRGHVILYVGRIKRFLAKG